MNVNEELKFLRKCQCRGGGGGGGGSGREGVGQGGCERRIEVIVNMQKSRGGVRWGGGQGGCERRNEVIVNMQKSRGRGGPVGGGGGVRGSYCENDKKTRVGVRSGVRLDVNEELKLLWK